MVEVAPSAGAVVVVEDGMVVVAMVVVEDVVEVGGAVVVVVSSAPPPHAATTSVKTPSIIPSRTFFMTISPYLRIAHRASAATVAGSIRCPVPQQLVRMP